MHLRATCLFQLSAILHDAMLIPNAAFPRHFKVEVVGETKTKKRHPIFSIIIIFFVGKNNFFV